jgi:hypothetical protein
MSILPILWWWQPGGSSGGEETMRPFSRRIKRIRLDQARKAAEKQARRNKRRP